jgi:hypothetical protein
MITRSLAAKLVWLLPLTVAPGACSTDAPVDIGHDVAKLSDYAANWDGYAEAATFPKGGSDRVRLRLDDTGEGTLEIGDAPRVPVPTQAEGGYLLDDVDNKGAGGAGGASGAFRDGFQYPVHQARVEAGRIRFGIDPLDLYGAWCKFVSPVVNETAPSGYACGASGGSRSLDKSPNECEFQTASGDPTQPNRIPVDCGIYDLCVGPGVCTCTSTACGPHVIPTDGTSLDAYPIVVDAAIDATGTSLTGTLAMKSGETTERITIRMLK